jgi:drug/metabolite transporter (DMT)-like permease
LSATSLGFAISFASSVFFAAYIFPRKLSTLPVWDYQFWLSVAVLPCLFGLAFVSGVSLSITSTHLWLSILCGVLWSAGSVCYSLAVDYIGVTRSTPIKNFAPVFAALYGVFLFQEYTLSKPSFFMMMAFGVLLMTFAAFLIGKASAPMTDRSKAFDPFLVGTDRRHYLFLGVLCSLGAAFFYGAYSVPLKYVLRHDVDPFLACAWLGVGVFASSFVFMMFCNRWRVPFIKSSREIRFALLAGILWAIAQLLGTWAMYYIPMSISWPVSNISTLIAVGWGVWIFHEVRIREHLHDVVWSLLLYSIGLVLLGFASSEGHV